jgi:DNA-binding protein HU-beta
MCVPVWSVSTRKTVYIGLSEQNSVKFNGESIVYQRLCSYPDRIIAVTRTVTHAGGIHMNKGELIQTLSGRLGDRKSATAALDAVLAEIQNAVARGDKVAITGFGVFENRVRAARTARNPRTGEAVKVKKTSVPAFRPGATFKDVVASGKLPRATKAAAPTKKTAPAKASKTAETAPTKKVAAPRKSAAPAKTMSRAAAAKKAPARTR